MKVPGLDKIGPGLMSVISSEAKSRANRVYGSVGAEAVDTILAGGVKGLPNSLVEAGGSILASEVGKYAGRWLSSNKKGVTRLLKLFGVKTHSQTVTDVVSAVNELPDPLMDWEFETQLPNLSTPGGMISALPWAYVEDILLPVESIATDSIFVNARQVHVPSSLETGTMTIKFYGDGTLRAQNYINAWYDLIVDRQGYYNLPYAADGMGYMKNIKTILYHKGVPVYMVVAIGCFPTSRDDLQLSGGGGERVSYSQTFSVNRIRAIALDQPVRTTQPFGNSILGKVGNAVTGALGQFIGEN